MSENKTIYVNGGFGFISFLILLSTCAKTYDNGEKLDRLLNKETINYVETKEEKKERSN